MPEDVKSLSDLLTTLADLLPGFILLYTRSRFTAGGQLPSLKENVALYVVLSAIYFILFGPLLIVAGSPLSIPNGPVLTAIGSYLTRALVFLLLPALFGLLLGVAAQRHIIKTCFLFSARAIGLKSIKLVDPTPTAWDWKFDRAESCHVIIKLKDQSTIYGWLGKTSFISSKPDERDLYIEQVYICDAEGNWHIKPGTGIWIAAGEVSTIEFVLETRT